jgi:hypothetical protein
VNDKLAGMSRGTEKNHKISVRITGLLEILENEAGFLSAIPRPSV